MGRFCKGLLYRVCVDIVFGFYRVITGDSAWVLANGEVLGVAPHPVDSGSSPE